jgi:hypothetical protein
VSPDGTIELSAEDAAPFIRVAWTKLAELPEDELPGYEDGYTDENEPWNPKLKYAIGSVESEAEIEQIVAAREAAKAQREKWRLARVAAFLENIAATMPQYCLLITPSTSPTSSGSSADVGSSTSMTRGDTASARAIATRCSFAPLSQCAVTTRKYHRHRAGRPG